MELGFQFRISTSKKLSPTIANGPWQLGMGHPTAHNGTRACGLWLLTPHRIDLRIMLWRIISNSLFRVENTSSHRTYSVILVVVLPVLFPITDLGGIKQV